MSLTNVKDLETFARQTMSSGGVQSTIEYLLNPSNDTYLDMCSSLVAAKNGFSAVGVSSPRILVTLADGTVAFDSNNLTSTDPLKQNTYANAIAKRINENHMSRVAVVSAALSQSGVAMEKKYSSSTRLNEQYLAHRLGRSAQDVQGIIRWSFSA